MKTAKPKNNEKIVYKTIVLSKRGDITMNLFPDDIFNLADIAQNVSRKDPNRIAVIDLDGFDFAGKRRYKYYTYKELSTDVESVACGLLDMGIKERTRIVFMVPPSYEACVIGLALTRVGATMVWIDPSVGWMNIAERLKRVNIEAFLGLSIVHFGRFIFGWGPRSLRKLIVIGKPGFPGAYTIDSLRRKAPEQPALPKVSSDDPAAILYTTGSTGPAKPAMYLHRNLCQLYRNAHYSWHFDLDKEVPVDLAVFPAFLFVPISAGGTMVVPPINFVRQGPADVDPQALLEVINSCGVKSMFGSPVLLEKMGRYAVDNGIITPSLKHIIGAGDVIKAPVEKLLLEMIGKNGGVYADYGATEAMPSAELNAEETLNDTWSKTVQGAGICVGQPLPGVHFRIISIIDCPIKNMDQAKILKVGDIGEIIVQGNHISPYYFNAEESTLKNKIKDINGKTWHRFGDAGYLDEQGRLWVCGRVSHRVITSTGPLFPLICEAIFETHSKVKRSGLVGVPRKEGEMPVICIELKHEYRSTDMVTLRAELLTLAAEHEPTRSIKHLLFTTSLPVDPRHNSKIERPILAKWAAKQLRKQHGSAHTEISE